jgi:aminoglycoside N3'-acetyltransferase
VAVGRHGDDLVREHELLNPLLPVKKFLKQDPKVVTAGVNLDSVTSIHLAEEAKAVRTYPMRSLIEDAKSLLGKNPRVLTCDNEECLSCALAGC